ncbi:transposase family protein [Streptomyces mirabilis]|uniref:transposase family protein n=1 Tax=Streptomyces mirabilis TaxID=68239 RepID=UPI0033B2C193
MFRGRGRHLADRREGDPGRRPRAGRPGRRTFVSRKRRQNTVKTATISDGQGRTLWSGAQRPGRMHDQTSVRTEGIAEQLHPRSTTAPAAWSASPSTRSAPRQKPKGMKAPNDGPVTERYGWREMKRRQYLRRICVEHANAEVRQWRPLQWHTGRRKTYGETHLAIDPLVSDRAAKRPTRHNPSTELVYVRATAC